MLKPDAASVGQTRYDRTSAPEKAFQTSLGDRLRAQGEKRIFVAGVIWVRAGVKFGADRSRTETTHLHPIGPELFVERVGETDEEAEEISFRERKLQDLKR